MELSVDQIKRVVEASLLMNREPTSAKKIAELFTPEENINERAIIDVITLLIEDYRGRGIELVEVASGYRFQVCADLAPWIQRTMTEKPQRYSRALLETLALIAYRQPITRAEIEEIRGVVVSTQIMRTLEEREWVRVIGHRDVPGRPALYATTKQFLNDLNLKSLGELPTLAELQDLDKVDGEFQQLNLDITNSQDDTAQQERLEAESSAAESTDSAAINRSDFDAEAVKDEVQEEQHLSNEDAEEISGESLEEDENALNSESLILQREYEDEVEDEDEAEQIEDEDDDNIRSESTAEGDSGELISEDFLSEDEDDDLMDDDHHEIISEALLSEELDEVVSIEVVESEEADPQSLYANLFAEAEQSEDDVVSESADQEISFSEEDTLNNEAEDHEINHEATPTMHEHEFRKHQHPETQLDESDSDLELTETESA